MKYNDISLPYPVLGVNDDVYPLLEDDCIQMSDPQKDSNEYTFKVVLSQKNEKITELIADGKAEYACEVTCKDTFLRRCFCSEKPVFNIVLSRREVNGRINFNCFIAVKEPILGYTNKGFNEDYKGFTFDL